MSVDKQTAAKVARLARISMNDNELDKAADELKAIVTWVEKLAEVDTDNVEPLPSPVDIELRQRDDVVNDGNCVDDVTKNAHETLEGYFVVPKVVE
jgi:aspartyl-tRNA(Asn)/glutamyl-tRNA(Gln) amidotransferase subunit C